MKNKGALMRMDCTYILDGKIHFKVDVRKGSLMQSRSSLCVPLFCLTKETGSLVLNQIPSL